MRVRVDGRIARWVRERQHYAFVEETGVLNSNDVIMAYEVHALRELASWILGWGSAVEPLEPPELREQIAAEAQKIVEMLT